MNKTNEMTDAWIELREPGRVPERKGPFKTAHLKSFLIEVLRVRPRALVTVVTHDGHDGPYFEDGPQYLEMMDGRYRHLAARHRKTANYR